MGRTFSTQSITLNSRASSAANSKMKLVAAYLLAVLGGNPKPSAEDIKKILGSVGMDADDDKLEFLLSQVKGKDINELLAAGREKLAFSTAAHGGGVLGVAATASTAATPAAAAESKKNEEKVEEKEEEEEDFMFSLFD